MTHDILKYLSDKIDETCRVIETDMALGHIKDFSEYKFACGRYRGLLNAKDIIIELAERMENDDD